MTLTPTLKEKYSKNDYAEKVVGKRNLPPNAHIFDFPCELGYHCPVCKYENPKDDYDERLDWSEYEGFIWCSVCNKDYPSCLCMPDIDKAIKIYLDCISQSKSKIVEQILGIIGKDEKLLKIKPNYTEYCKWRNEIITHRNQLRLQIKEEIQKL